MNTHIKENSMTDPCEVVRRYLSDDSTTINACAMNIGDVILNSTQTAA